MILLISMGEMLCICVICCRNEKIVFIFCLCLCSVLWNLLKMSKCGFRLLRR